MENAITLTWYGHACFALSAAGFTLVLDPYAPGSVPGLPERALTANAVLCTHGHADHSFAAGVTIVPPAAPSPFRVEELAAFHDGENGARRGENTIFIIEASGLRIAHLGDLGHPLTPRQRAALTGLDAMLLPVGGHFTIDAAQARALVEETHPRVVLPMHYRGETFGYPVLAPVEEYLALCVDVRRYDGCTFTLTPETQAQTAVLTPAP